MRVEKVAIESVAGTASAASAESCASSRLHQGLEPSCGTGFSVCVSHGQSLLPRKLTNLSCPLFLPQLKPVCPQRARPLPVCWGHTGCGKTRAREVWQPSFSLDLGKVSKKLVCKLSVLLARPSVCLGRGSSGGRLWLFWAAGVAGGAAGRSAAAPAAEKTCFQRFGRLRVGKSSTRMANRCPRIFDAGGKGRDPVGCWRSLHH